MGQTRSMSRFRPYNPDQAYLLPPSVKEVLPSGHLCFFLQQMMARLDLEPLEQEYSDEGGQLYHPALIALVYMGATLFSALKFWAGRGGEWKGRIQDTASSESQPSSAADAFAS